MRRLIALALFSLLPVFGQVWQIPGKGGGSSSGSGVSWGAYPAPATCKVGDVYEITSGLFDKAICTSANTWAYYYESRPIVPASALGATLAGTTTGVTVDTSKGYELITAAPNTAVTNFAFRYINVPAGSTYSALLAVRLPRANDTNNYHQLFFGWTDVTTGYQGMDCGTGSGSFGTSFECRIATFATAGNFISAQTSLTTFPHGPADIRYVRLSYDGSRCKIDLCTDSDNCTPYSSFDPTVFFTGGLPTKLAWGIQNSNSSFGNFNLTVIGQE